MFPLADECSGSEVMLTAIAQTPSVLATENPLQIGVAVRPDRSARSAGGMLPKIVQPNGRSRSAGSR